MTYTSAVFSFGLLILLSKSTFICIYKKLFVLSVGWDVDMSFCQNTLDDTKASLQISMHNLNVITFSQSHHIDGVIGLLNVGRRNTWVLLENSELFEGWQCIVVNELISYKLQKYVLPLKIYSAAQRFVHRNGCGPLQGQKALAGDGCNAFSPPCPSNERR